MKPAHTPQLRDTQEAFDSVAVDYEGPRGNNVLIQEMRHEMWRWLDVSENDTADQRPRGTRELDRSGPDDRSGCS